jgi:rod shape determining protein RodA
MNFIKLFIIDRKQLKEVDFGIIIAAVLLLLFGALNISRATGGGDGLSSYGRLQVLWLLVSLVVMYIILLMDYRMVYKMVDVLYWITVVLLVVVLATGKVKGAAGWFSIGQRGFQPAEFAKLTTMLMLGKKLQQNDGNLNNIPNFVSTAVYALIPMILMMLQPDMGLTMVTFFITLGIFFSVGLSMKVIGSGFGFIAVAVGFVLNTDFLPAHWKARLSSFLFEEGSDLGINYQLTQSVISIGSGKLTGSATKGFYSRVPENHTDFIFAVVAENFGFIGGLVLLFLYGFIMYRMIAIAKSTEDIFGKCIAVGVFSIFLFSVLQNVGMTMGLMPISGITLPLVSYGGSSVLTTFIALGMVLNVGMKRKTTLF